MNLQRKHFGAFGPVLLALVVAVAFAATAEAAIVPLRSGSVVSKTDSDVFAFIKAVDDAGKQFWVITSICTIGEKGKIAVLSGTHYDKVKSEQHGVLEDVYVGDQVKIGDVQVVGFGAHGLPSGCVLME